MRKSLTFLPLFIATSLFFAAPADAAVTVSGPLATSSLLPGFTTVGTRHRELESTRVNGNDQEHYLGRNDLGRAPNRSGADHRYVLGDNIFSLTLVNGTLTSVMNGSRLSRADVFNWAGAAADQPFDTLQFSIRDGQQDNNVIALNNLVMSGTGFRGNSITNITLGDFAGVDGGGFRFWTVTGLDFRQDFALTGTLGLLSAGGRFSSSAELNRVDMVVGNGPMIQIPVPEVSTWIMMITGFAFVGTALRVGRRMREEQAGAAAA